MKTVTGRGYIRSGLAIAVTMAMVWGTGAAAGTARAQDAITGVQAAAQTPTAQTPTAQTPTAQTPTTQTSTTQTPTTQTPARKQADAITSDGMPIVITELAVDTGNAIYHESKLVTDNAKIDSGEFVELTNMGSAPVGIDDISLNYNGVDWTPEAFDLAASDHSKNVEIRPGASVVLWDNYAGVAKAGTVSPEDFNAFWKHETNIDPQLVPGSTLFTISKGSGMANNGPRKLVVRQRSTGASDTVTYSSGGTTGTTLDVAYASDGTGTIADGQQATPGTVKSSQIPSSWPSSPGAQISAQDVSSVPDSVPDDKPLRLSVKVQSNQGDASIGKVRLFWKTNADSEFLDSTFDGVKNDDVWTFTVPAESLHGRTSMTYRFSVTSSAGAVVDSGERTLTITAPDDSSTSADVPLVITEVAPDTTNVGSGDGYEFIEVTNVSEKAVDFSDNYTLYYSYPNEGSDGDVAWDPVQTDISIQAGRSVVFWIKNGPNNDLGADAFNKNYGLAGDRTLIMGKDLFEIRSAGMANNSARTLKIATKTKSLISSARYPDNASKNLTGSSHSLQYSYAHGTESTLARTDQSPTPGYVESGDILAAPYIFPTGIAPPNIADTTKPGFAYGQDIDFAFDVTSAGGSINRVTLYTRNGDTGQYTSHNLVKTEGSDSYTYVENKINLVRVPSVQYYLEVSDGLNPVVRLATPSSPRIVTNTEFDNSPVRLNVKDGQFVRGTVALRGTAADGKTASSLDVDGKPVGKDATTASLESEPYIAADVTQTDIFFMNSFTKKLVVGGTPDGEDWKKNVIGTFDDGTYGATSTASFPISLTDIPADGKLSLYLNAGTKSSPTDILEGQQLPINTENADNYTASNIRLVLPDGTVLRASKATAGISPGASGDVSERRDVTAQVRDADEKLSMGDSQGNYEFIRLDFTIDPSSFSSREYLWNTTNTADGSHTITASANGSTTTVHVNVDNTAPLINGSVTSDATSGDVRRGAIAITANPADPASKDGVGSGLQESNGQMVQATLANGSAAATSIDLPYHTTSAQLPSGKHTVTFTAADKAGNAATQTMTFTTVQERPEIVSTGGARQEGSKDAKLNVKVAEAADDKVTAVFHPGETFTPADSSVVTEQGTTDRAGLTADSEKNGTVVTAKQAQSLDKGDDDKTVSTTGSNYGFPFQKFTVQVPRSFVDDPQASTTISWRGSAEPGADIYAFVRNAANGGWEQVAQSRADGTGSVSIEQNVALKDRVSNGVMSVEIQNGVGFTSGQQTKGASAASEDAKVTYDNAKTINGVDGKPVITMDNDTISQAPTDRSKYDFTFAWESDTQYYNANYENDGFFSHQKDIHDFLLENRDAMNIQYLFHTGDIVDNADIADQWKRADAQYKRLDDAHFPYGVLAGNHDVDHKSEDYTNFSKYFGQSRYEGNPWYGGSYKNNRGHYDLISAGGIDFIVVSVGWGIGDEEIDWMNQVLAKYPNRVAILDFHEYLLASGGLGLAPQAIYQQVVTKNKNVKMVLSGHYHSAQKTVSQIDDNGDGKPDRNVVNMLFDYQAMAEGGMGFIRLMHVNVANDTMEVRTYSPSTQRYGSQDEPSSSFTPSDEEFTIDLSQLGIAPHSAAQRAKTLTSDSMRVDMLSSKVIATAVSGESSGPSDDAGSQTVKKSIDALWADAPTVRAGWYAVVSNPYGGTATSEVSYLDPAGGSNGVPGDDNDDNHGNASNPPTNDTGRTPSANGNHAPDGSAGDQYEQRGGGRQLENAGTRVLSSTGADITHIGAALLLLLTVGSMLVAMVMPGKRRGDGTRE